MKTRSQSEFEARIRAKIRAERAKKHKGANDSPDSDPLERCTAWKSSAEERWVNERSQAIRQRVDENGNRIPSGAYRSAAEHHFAYREFRRERHPRNALAHAAMPIDESNLYTRSCELERCGRVFVTSARQRRFCSEKCVRKDQRKQAAEARKRYEAATMKCSRSECAERFFRLRQDHRFCSAKCRTRACQRSRVMHQERPCEACNAMFTPRNSRAKFCSDRCRVRSWSRSKGTGSSDHSI